MPVSSRYEQQPTVRIFGGPAVDPHLTFRLSPPCQSTATIAKLSAKLLALDTVALETPGGGSQDWRAGVRDAVKLLDAATTRF